MLAAWVFFWSDGLWHWLWLASFCTRWGRYGHYEGWIWKRVNLLEQNAFSTPMHACNYKSIISSRNWGLKIAHYLRSVYDPSTLILIIVDRHVYAMTRRTFQLRCSWLLRMRYRIHRRRKDSFVHTFKSELLLEKRAVDLVGSDLLHRNDIGVRMKLSPSRDAEVIEIDRRVHFAWFMIKSNAGPLRASWDFEELCWKPSLNTYSYVFCAVHQQWWQHRLWIWDCAIIGQNQ